MKKVRDIHELRDIQLNILQYVHNLCEKHKLVYFLCGGSLIGAVRHQGYIPWDDDIDIMMPRKDYDKLIRLVNTDKTSPFRANTYLNCPELGCVHMKVSDTRTLVYQKNYYRINGLGVNIDVFPYDGLSNSAVETSRAFDSIELLRLRLYKLVRLDPNSGRKPPCRVPIWRIPVIMYLCLRIDRIAKKYSIDKSDKAACVMAVKGGKKEIIDRKAFEKRRLAVFENREFYMPCGYHEYLRNLHGDYMKFPPASQRRITHGTVAWWK